MNKFLYKIPALIIAASLLLSSSNPTMGAEKEISFTALQIGINKALSDNKTVSIDANNKAVTPFVKNNRTLIPLRFVSESFGAQVLWNESDKSISIKYDANNISFFIGQSTVIINGVSQNIDVAPEIFSDRTYIPLRAFSEAMGNNIFWDERGLIIITRKGTTLSKENDIDLINKIFTRLDNERLRVKGLYLTGLTASDDKLLQSFIDMAKKSKINTFVIDVKDTDGYIPYQGNLENVKKQNAYLPFYDASSLIKKLHENDIYVIGRVACFEDSILNTKNSDLVLKTKSGDVWKSPTGQTALDPSNKILWEYIKSISQEALSFGFDEIQLDCVRYDAATAGSSDYKIPSDGKKNEIINDFLGYIKSSIPYAKIGVGIYGSTCENENEKDSSGQDLETLINNVDSVAPVLYPGYFPIDTKINGVNFEKPDLFPYEVVKNSLQKTTTRLKKVQGRKASVRPYLQAFTAKWLGAGYHQQYTIEQVKQQIKAVYDAGYDEWILWDSKNEYFNQLINDLSISP